MVRSVESFLAALHDLGVRFTLDGERLRCRAPRGALTTAVKAELDARKNEIRGFLGRTLGSSGPSHGPIPRAPRDGELPLSHGQSRLWLLDRLEGTHASYNIPASMRLDGTLAIVALKRAIGEVARRHEILRTTYPEVNGTPVQRINAAAARLLPVVDVGVERREQAGELRRLAVAEARRPFDLVRGPLLRVILLRLAPRRHVMLLTLHHIAADGWSLGIFARELADWYRALIQGVRPVLDPLPIQYADYARWERERFRNDRFGDQFEYWRVQLEDAPPCMELPTDRSTANAVGRRGGAIRREIEARLLQRMKGLAGARDATLYVVLLTYFAALLSRHTRQRDLIIGMPLTQRPRRELEPLIGFFVNSLPLRIRWGDDPDFSELTAHVRDAVLGALSNQELVQGLFVQLFWILVGFAIFRLSWRSAIKRYSAVGG